MEIFEAYISRMSEIRELSSPSIKKLDDAELYSRRLADNFKRIGELAEENRKVLNDVVFPLIESEEHLSDEQIEKIRKFNEDLVNDAELENLDIGIMGLISERLMRDAAAKESDEYYILQLDQEMVAAYTLMYMTSRISTDLSISGSFRKKGIDAYDRLMEFLPPERFDSLSDEAKDIVITATRYGSFFYESASGIDAATAHSRLVILRRALDVYKDPFYHASAPNYDWEYFHFRVFENHGNIEDSLYDTLLPQEELEEIERRLQEQSDLWKSDPDLYSDFAPYNYVLANLLRAQCRAGHLEGDSYREQIFRIYETRDRRAYDFDNVYLNLKVPFDYILSFGKTPVTERDRFTLRSIYRNFCGYVFYMPNSGTLSALLEYVSGILQHFIEVPGGISFKEYGLRLLAALHPPTYVHSMMVAMLSRCIASHLYHAAPELFSEGFYDREEGEIIGYAYDAGLCHDFGKLCMIDTIFVYGRKLLDFEFDVIKQHPALGAQMMEKYNSTKPFVDVAKGHHRWYDNSKGYPDSFDTTQSPVKIIIDIVAVADCMDAATDTIGRSYNKGKTLDDFINELKNDAGTRYNPHIASLFQNKEVYDDIQYLLSEGRQNNYRNAYLLLKEVGEEENQ